MTPRSISPRAAPDRAARACTPTWHPLNHRQRVLGPYDALRFPGRVHLIPLEKAMSEPLLAEPGPCVYVDDFVMIELANAVCWATHVWTTGSKPIAGKPTDALGYRWTLPDWHGVGVQFAKLAPALKPGPMLQLIAKGLASGSAADDDAMVSRVRTAAADPTWRRFYHATNDHAAAHLAKAELRMKAMLHTRGPCSAWVCELGQAHEATPSGTPFIGLQSLQIWRTKLLNNIRSRAAFRDLRGLFWQLGYSPSKGYYLSVIGVTRGGETFAREQRADLVRHWVDTVTNGRGTAFHPNPQVINRLPSILEVQDRSAKNLDFLVRSYFSYLLYSAEFMQLKLPEKTHQLAWKLTGATA